MICGYTRLGIPLGDYDDPDMVAYMDRMTPLCMARRIFDDEGREERTQTGETQPSERHSEKPLAGVPHGRNIETATVSCDEKMRVHFEREKCPACGAPVGDLLGEEWVRLKLIEDILNGDRNADGSLVEK